MSVRFLHTDMLVLSRCINVAHFVVNQCEQ
uniref:Uncharacterized protein n=1 Tax=Anguilla anguilla TaxID=7936 RepID=A0A0E9TEA2_ANGAN